MFEAPQVNCGASNLTKGLLVEEVAFASEVHGDSGSLSRSNYLFITN
jgi:hypothetical protein